MDEMTVELSGSIEIMVDGDKIDASTVLLKCPTGKVRKQVAKINDLFGSVAIKMGERTNASATQPEAIEFDGKMLVGMMTMGGEISTASDLLEEIYAKGFASLEGQPLNGAILDRMKAQDIMRIHEEYLGNFMMPSWMEMDGTA